MGVMTGLGKDSVSIDVMVVAILFTGRYDGVGLVVFARCFPLLMVSQVMGIGYDPSLLIDPRLN